VELAVENGSILGEERPDDYRRAVRQRRVYRTKVARQAGTGEPADAVAYFGDVEHQFQGGCAPHGKHYRCEGRQGRGPRLVTQHSQLSEDRPDLGVRKQPRTVRRFERYSYLTFEDEAKGVAGLSFADQHFARVTSDTPHQGGYFIQAFGANALHEGHRRQEHSAELFRGERLLRRSAAQT
jgi:hypothetical protein